MKVRIPFIIENGVNGPVLTPFFIGLFHPNGIFPDYFVIEDETIFHTGTKKTFGTKKAKSLIIEETELIPIKKDFKFDFYKPVGKEIKLFLNNSDFQREQILPTFLYSVQQWGKKDWERFIGNLSEILSLPVEINNNAS